MIYTCTRKRTIKRLLDLTLVSAALLAWAALLPAVLRLPVKKSERSA